MIFVKSGIKDSSSSDKRWASLASASSSPSPSPLPSPLSLSSPSPSLPSEFGSVSVFGIDGGTAPADAAETAAMAIVSADVEDAPPVWS